MSHAAAGAAVAENLRGPVSVAIPDARGLHAFDISPARGWLPAADPLLRLPPAFDAWESLAADLPALRLSDGLIDRVRRLPLIDVSPLRGGAEAERAMALLSFVANAYLHALPSDDEAAPPALPANLAVPFEAVARRVGRRPEMSYASAVLHNWRRIDPDRPVAIGNLAVLHGFTGAGGDEAWFVLTLVAAEAAAAGALASVQPASRCVTGGDFAGATRHLESLAEGLEAVSATLARLGEYCDRYAWELRARPLYQPRADVVLEQVGRPPAAPPPNGAPDLFARSAVLPVVAALLRIDDSANGSAGPAPVEPYWLPPAHAAFVQHVARGPNLRHLLDRPGAPVELRSAYNRCSAGVARIRAELDDWLGDDLLPDAPDDNAGTAMPAPPRGAL